jgi:ribosomal protein S18 acetylase RimI-like enzyme
MKLAEPVRLAEGQVAASGAVLARAFTDDPFFTYVPSDPAERERLMPPLMTAWTRYGLLFGVVEVTAGPVEASAIWLPPDAVVRTPERMEQAGVTAVVNAFSAEARARLDAIAHSLRSAREAAQSVPHWYLHYIGVDPARQGFGLGGLLLRAGLARVDRDGVECHLITWPPGNVRLYQRYGFEVAVEGDVPGGGPRFRYMRRRPRLREV